MLRSAELDVSTVLEALAALNDGIAIYGPDDRQFFVNGAKALAALERETFDLVLLDMHMPVMDGPTTIAKIRASVKPWAAIPVIALTADVMSGDRERYLGRGMNGYLSKPLAERDLLSEISRVRDAASALPMAQAS